MQMHGVTFLCNINLGLEHGPRCGIPKLYTVWYLIRRCYSPIQCEFVYSWRFCMQVIANKHIHDILSTVLGRIFVP